MQQTFNIERVAQVIRTEAVSQSRADFLATHTPFKRLSYTFSAGQIVPRVEDEELFLSGQILAKRNDHQFIVVKGNSGSGKSHLIRWLKERYVSEANAQDEVVLFIERSQNSLRGTLEQILNSGIFPSGFPAEEIKKLTVARQNLTGEDLALKIVHEFAMAADKASREKVKTPLENRYLGMLHDFLVDPVIRESLCCPGGPVERLKDRLSPESNELRQDRDAQFTPEDFGFCRIKKRQMRGKSSKSAMDLAEDLGDDIPSLKEKVCSFLNQSMEAVIQNCTHLQSADLRAVFERLRVELKKAGKRLALFIEDITSFTGLDRALMDVLVAEHIGEGQNSKFCRLYSVIGVTDYYYDKYFQDNYRSRITCLVLSDQAVLNTEESAVEMAARYINAISLPPGSIQGWLAAGAQGEDLPLAAALPGSEWATCELNRRTFSIYPFNQQALKNIYQSMREKNPRRFLKDVLAFMLNIYAGSAEGSGKFPPPAKEIGEFRLPPLRAGHEQIVINQSDSLSEQICTLLRSWGDGTALSREINGKRLIGGLGEEVFAAFSLPFIKGVDGGTDPRPPAGPLTPPVEPGTTTGGGEQANPQGLKKFNKLVMELEKWANGDSLPTFRELRQDMRDLIFEYIDWESIEIPAILVSYVFKNIEYFSIEGQTGRYYEGYKIHRGRESRYALEAMAAWRHLGNKSWDFKGSATYLNTLVSWLENNKHQIIRKVVAPPGVKSLSSWDIGRWSVLGDIYCQIFSSSLGSTKYSREELYKEIFKPYTRPTVQDECTPGWKSAQKKAQERIAQYNHDLVLRYFALIQGDIFADSSVFFINAARALEVIDGLSKNNWDLNAVSAEEIDSDAREHAWYRGLALVEEMQKVAGAALVEEEEMSKKALAELEGLLGSDVSLSRLEILFNEMQSFFNETLKNANEAYNAGGLDGLLTGSHTAPRMARLLQRVEKAVAETDMIKKWATYSNNPRLGLQIYLNLLQKVDKVLDEKHEKYTKKLEDKIISQDLQNLKQDIEKLLKYYIEEISHCSEGNF